MASRSTFGTLGKTAAGLAAALGVGALVGTVVAPAHDASAVVDDLSSLAHSTADDVQGAVQSDDGGWSPQAPPLSSGGPGGGHAQSAGS